MPSTRPSIRRPVLMREFVLSVRPHAALEVDVRIAHLIARRAVADNEQQNILGGSIDEAMRIAGSGRKADAHAGFERLDAGVALQFDFAFENIDELVLPRMGVAR